eukprot:646514-Hanusia_phi.AAC.2
MSTVLRSPHRQLARNHKVLSAASSLLLLSSPLSPPLLPSVSSPRPLQLTMLASFAGTCGHPAAFAGSHSGIWQRSPNSIRAGGSRRVKAAAARSIPLPLLLALAPLPFPAPQTRSLPAEQSQTKPQTLPPSPPRSPRAPRP